jgi:DNA-directed RNA polymerase specialized sigma24 family protein
VVQELDTLLYAWLSEPDERRAEQRFTCYFRAAFPEICRFLRSFRADSATAEDLSQQALIKLFAHLGTERKSADMRLREALSALAPLAFGALHARLVHGWRDQVGAFRDSALCFRIPHDVKHSCEAWKELRDELNGRIEPLQRQGTHFLREVRERVASAFHALIACESPERGISDAAQVQVASFVATLLQYAADRDSTQLDTALGCEGAVGFVTRTSTVCEGLPALAIPSNGLLYTIAKRQFLDSLRRSRTDRVATAAVSEQAGLSLLEDWDVDDRCADDHAAPEADAWIRSAVPDPGDLGDGGRALERRYQEFLEFLRAPLTRAEGVLAEAASKGKAKAEQARVDSLRRKYQRLIAILTALRESPQPSEAEIARREGLTRNQVKYVIQRVREEFNYFFPDLARDTQGRRRRQRAEP